jgi:hypothetical protein
MTLVPPFSLQSHSPLLARRRRPFLRSWLLYLVSRRGPFMAQSSLVPDLLYSPMSVFHVGFLLAASPKRRVCSIAHARWLLAASLVLRPRGVSLAVRRACALGVSRHVGAPLLRKGMTLALCVVFMPFTVACALSTLPATPTCSLSSREVFPTMREPPIRVSGMTIGTYSRMSAHRGDVGQLRVFPPSGVLVSVVPPCLSPQALATQKRVHHASAHWGAVGKLLVFYSSGVRFVFSPCQECVLSVLL